MLLPPRDGMHDRAAVAQTGVRGAGTASFKAGFKATIAAATEMAASEGATVPEGGAAAILPGAPMPGDAALEAAGAEAVERDATPHAEPPAARAMHVFHSQQGAHVFVRDAQIDPRAAHALVARIAAELALGGTRLAAMTLNGRTIYEAPAQPQAARERDSESNANQEGR